MFRHEIPTHLGVQDKLILGLSARQLMLVLAGLTAAHAVWSQLAALAWLPLAARVALACAVAAVFLAAALVRPHGRGLDEWAFAIDRYAALPKVSIWRREAAGAAHLSGAETGPDRTEAQDARPAVPWRAGR